MIVVILADAVAVAALAVCAWAVDARGRALANVVRRERARAARAKHLR